MTRRVAVLLTIVAAVSLSATLALAADNWETLNRAAREAVKAGDYATLRETLGKLDPLMPGNVRIVYNLAASNSMLQDPAQALDGLDRLCRMGVIFDLEADPDFAPLKSSPRFADALACMAKNGEPVTHARLAIMLPGTDLLPEDLAYDTQSRRFLVSSIRENRILDATGKTFATSKWPVLALAIDSKRRTLWATTGWLPQCDTCRAEERDKSALVGFNLDTGAEIRRVPSPVPGLLGDITIGRGGDLFVSEGAHGAIFRLRPGSLALERLDVEGEFASPQQPALSEDEQTLYVADYLRGIAAVNLGTKAVTWLQPGPDVALSGIDGLQVFGKFFIAVQNGTNPARIVRMPLDLKSQEVLEANWAGLGEPSHGIVVGHDYLFLANTGWNAYEESGRKRAGSAPVDSSIWKLPLD